MRGINVHARRVVGGRDRPQIERLCRYVTRPPLAQERLELRRDGRLELTLKNIWRDGTRAIIFEPHDLLARLVAAVPPPRFHLLRYFGVLSGHSALRSEVVPEPEDDPADLAGTRTRKSPARGHANRRHADTQIAGMRTRKSPACGHANRWHADTQIAGTRTG